MPKSFLSVLPPTNHCLVNPLQILSMWVNANAVLVSFRRKTATKNMHNDQPCDQGFIVSIGLCFPSSWSFLGGHFLCFFFTEPKLKLKGYSVLYRQQRKGWSMSQHYWPGDTGLSKDKLCWRDDQAYSKLCLASSAIWALKPNPALSQGQTSGLYRLCCIWVDRKSVV